MCDAHLVVAKTEQDGLACFFVPRWLEDGTKNPIHIQRLKKKSAIEVTLVPKSNLKRRGAS
jgi:alkylation response protein AidB-like acyl-CoA dehydrogenase